VCRCEFHFHPPPLNKTKFLLSFPVGRQPRGIGGELLEVFSLSPSRSLVPFLSQYLFQV
jgi:hypothetical protein